MLGTNIGDAVLILILSSVFGPNYPYHVQSCFINNTQFPMCCYTKPQVLWHNKRIKKTSLWVQSWQFSVPYKGFKPGTIRCIHEQAQYSGVALVRPPSGRQNVVFIVSLNSGTQIRCLRLKKLFLLPIWILCSFQFIHQECLLTFIRMVTMAIRVKVWYHHGNKG